MKNNSLGEIRNDVSNMLNVFIQPIDNHFKFIIIFSRSIPFINEMICH